MHVVVIGAGVVGLTTAYYLSQLGCQVTVVDRENDVAAGASFANAGQLSYSFTDALARPSFIGKIPGVLTGRDNAYQVRPEPGLIPWGLQFLSQCTNKRAKENTLAVLQIATRSAQLMHELREAVPFEFSSKTAGKLVLLTSRDEVEAATANAAIKSRHGCETQIVTANEALAIEPALTHLSEEFVAAVYSRSDEVADPYLFAVGMRTLLEESNDVIFRLGTEVERLSRVGRGVRAVELSDDTIEADSVVVCTGAWSGALLRSVGINPHIYPVRGYSVTLPPGEASPNVSVTALGRKIVFSRIGGRIRIAGFADFGGFKTDDDTKRIAALVTVARNFAPLAADYDADEQKPWGGFRPMTPDGRPHVGKTNIDGLYLNTGHGMLGWTLACASGYDVAHAVTQSI